MAHPRVDISNHRSPHSLANKLGRVMWAAVWLLLFRPSPKVLWGWRRGLLKLFGARMGRATKVHNAVRVWAPWNLAMGPHSSMAYSVDCYNVGMIRIGSHTTISQYSHLCAATHDHRDPRFPLVIRPITVGSGVWIAAGAFIGPGVTVGEGAVVAARACICRDVPAWKVVAGNPARIVQDRRLPEG